MAEHNTYDLGERGVISPSKSEQLDGLLNVIDAAADQGQMTWLTETGPGGPKRVAAIVPVADAEYLETRWW